MSDIDKKIHKDLFGLCWHKFKDGITICVHCNKVVAGFANPSYSTNITDAMKIPSRFLGRKQEEFAHYLINSYGDNNHNGAEKFIMFLTDPEAPMKICRSALKIMEG